MGTTELDKYLMAVSSPLNQACAVWFPNPPLAALFQNHAWADHQVGQDFNEKLTGTAPRDWEVSK